MSEVDQKDFNRHWFDLKLAELRRHLEEGQLPGGVKRIASEIRQLTDRTPEYDVQAIDIMFAVALHDALQGLDISERHPGFFRILLADSLLREDFLAALDAIIADKTGSVSAVPATLLDSAPPIVDLLQRKQAPRPVQEASPAGTWRLRWNRTIDQLLRLFTPLGFSATYRVSPSALEDEIVTLIHDQVRVRDLSLQLLLELTHEPETPHLLQPVLTVAALEPIALEQLHVSIQWGAYHTKSAIDADGRANLPPIPVGAVLDESGDAPAADLQLTLEPSPSTPADGP